MDKATQHIDVGNLDTYVTHDYATNNGVRLHYAQIGEGPLVVMLHGFPDFWYTWRAQMAVLASRFHVVAPDLRGYNLSDKPTGGEQYAMRRLVEDVVAVIRHVGEEKAVIVGHDWGGAIAWQFAMYVPEMIERLIILNMLHPLCLARELAQHAQQHEASAYVRTFQQEGAHRQLTAEALSAWVQNPATRERYLEALNCSDFEAMLHYYKQNFPRPPYQDNIVPRIKVQAPVLQIHGLQDQRILAGGLNNTWDWLANEWTLLTIPDAGHFVQHDASALVTQTMWNWLTRSRVV
ncbi:MAG TPA: alpha/beta hydrolase [Ktedonobacterales bacterium]|nr:alpha/beta hydrolase [Ktedonobacterales bacterium]